MGDVNIPGAWLSHTSWGRTLHARTWVQSLSSRHETLPPRPMGLSRLAHGLGRSYGDSCLNDQNSVILTPRMNCLLAFDRASGILRAEAGLSILDLNAIFVPQGFFLPVTPGTQYVTLGGALANDVHGKNHHATGTIGRFITAFELLRSDGSRTTVTRETHPDLFRATVGGLGLTGLITWVEIKLRTIANAWIESETIKFTSINEFLEINTASEKDFECTVAWVDCLDAQGRGHYIRGNHAPSQSANTLPSRRSRPLNVPIEFPDFALNSWSVQAFNELYFRRQFSKHQQKLVHYEPFFYPLDAVGNWNRIYGKRGFYQYQCVVPVRDQAHAMKEIFRTIAKAQQGSFLAVLKTFGAQSPEGILSFPRPGITLALDFPNEGADTVDLFTRLDRIVEESGGALYPAKDGRMSANLFERSFPRWREMLPWIDPEFSSSFWRRVTS